MFREPSCTHELLRLPTSSQCRPLRVLHGEPSQPRWLPDGDEPQVQALQHLQGAARMFMPLKSNNIAPKSLLGQARTPQQLHGPAAQVLRPLQSQMKAKTSRPMQPRAPPRLQRAAKMLMPLQAPFKVPRTLPVQLQVSKEQLQVCKEQQVQGQAQTSDKPQDLNQVPEEFQGQDQVPDQQQRQGQEPEQKQRYIQLSKQQMEPNKEPEQSEIQTLTSELFQSDLEAEKSESLRVHAQVFLPLLSQNHNVLLPLHLDTQVLIPVEEQTEGSSQAQDWTVEPPEAVGPVQALVEAISRDILQAPNSNNTKSFGPLQTLMANLSSNMFYSHPEQVQKKKSKIFSLKQALTKKLSSKWFQEKLTQKFEDFELSDLEVQRQKSQHRWEDISTQQEEESRQVANVRVLC